MSKHFACSNCWYNPCTCGGMILPAQEYGGRRQHGNGMRRNSWNRLQWLRKLANDRGMWVPSDVAMNKMPTDKCYAELERLERLLAGDNA